ncbi:MAG: Gfo/Idh/MocA family oxidoreductase [Planctomycetota bacterium]|nr:Gfo/Idh/MocA family oxidoreductase [Planctomycetota bacterium]
MLRIAIVGARQKRQGTGPWIANAFKKAGCHVVAVLGTQPETANQAKDELHRRFGIDCEAYVSLSQLIAEQEVDVLAICSPARFHREHLQAALEANLHVFCEKPLWYDPPMLKDSSGLEAEVKTLCEGFLERNRLLELNTQWPCTLGYFWALYPELKGIPTQSLKMRLSPVSQGPIMVVDSAPHILSLLQALLGVGTVHAVSMEPLPVTEKSEGDAEDRSLKFIYRHGGGESDVELILRRCLEQPRPAWYSINGRKIRREVTLPAYTIEFVSETGRVKAEDPLLLRVFEFVQAIQSQQVTNCDAIVSDMVALAKLARAVQDTA